jgi:hypothetical protein
VGRDPGQDVIRDCASCAPNRGNEDPTGARKIHEFCTAAKTHLGQEFARLAENSAAPSDGVRFAAGHERSTDAPSLPRTLNMKSTWYKAWIVLTLQVMSGCAVGDIASEVSEADIHHAVAITTQAALAECFAQTGGFVLEERAWGWNQKRRITINSEAMFGEGQLPVEISGADSQSANLQWTWRADYAGSSDTRGQFIKRWQLSELDTNKGDKFERKLQVKTTVHRGIIDLEVNLSHGGRNFEGFCSKSYARTY